MPEKLASIEAIWLSQFIDENWSQFLAFMEERDGEEAAQKLSDKLVTLGNQ